MVKLSGVVQSENHILKDRHSKYEVILTIIYNTMRRRGGGERKWNGLVAKA
jgi:hypothetical protein